MSAPPRRSSRRSSRGSSAAAAAPSAGAASSPAAVDDRRAVDAAASAGSVSSALVGDRSNASMIGAAAEPPSSSSSVASGAAHGATAPSAQRESAAIGAAASSGSAVTTPPSAGYPVRKLYRHVLESIFAFGSLSDLHSLSQVNREWSAAVLTMAPINTAFAFRDFAHLFRICNGRLRRHISDLRPPSLDRMSDRLVLPELTAVSIALPDLHVVRAQLVHEVGQHANLELACSALLRFPSLHHLHIGMCTDGDQRSDVSLLPTCNRIIETCGLLPAATMHTLVLELPRLFADLSLAPLKALTRLRVLELRLFYPQATRSMSDDQIAHLSAITSIEQLLRPFDELDPGVLPRLCPPGSTRSWTKLSHVRVTPQIVPCFAAVSGLTSLAVTWLAGQEYSCLSQLPQLTDLGLRGRSAHPIDADGLTRALKSCTQIASLHLTNLPLMSRHLEDLFPCLPRLSRVLLHLTQLESLRCFATPALSASLTSLSLWSAGRCPPAELVHLLGLRSLEQLTCAIAVRVSAEHRAAFVRGARFPRLKSVSFQPVHFFDVFVRDR